MARQPVPCRLEPELVTRLNAEAQAAQIKPATHVAAIIEAHLRRNGSDAPAPSDKFLEVHDEILKKLEFLLVDAKALNDAVGQKEREASRDFANARKQIDTLRSDIATLFAAALETFAGVETEKAIAFTQTYMYPAAGRR